MQPQHAFAGAQWRHVFHMCSASCRGVGGGGGGGGPAGTGSTAELDEKSAMVVRLRFSAMFSVLC